MGAEEGDGRLAEVAIIVVFACAFAKVRGEGDCGTGKESIATLADSPAKAMAECFIGGKGHGFEKIMMDVAMMLLKTLWISRWMDLTEIIFVVALCGLWIKRAVG